MLHVEVIQLAVYRCTDPGCSNTCRVERQPNGMMKKIHTHTVQSHNTNNSSCPIHNAPAGSDWFRTHTVLVEGSHLD